MRAQSLEKDYDMIIVGAGPAPHRRVVAKCHLHLAVEHVAHLALGFVGVALGSTARLQGPVHHLKGAAEILINKAPVDSSGMAWRTVCLEIGEVSDRAGGAHFFDILSSTTACKAWVSGSLIFSNT